MKTITTIFYLVLSALVVSAQPKNTAVNLDFINKIPLWMTEHKVPTVGVGLIENGELKFHKVFGELKIGHPAPLNSLFNIASQTKPVVAMLTLKLVQSGKWNLDEPLYKYWVDPDIRDNPWHKKITTRIILNHQTGFANNREAKKLDFSFEPGTQTKYSGEGFDYLRRAMESKFKEPLEKLLNRILFQSIPMLNTQYWNSTVDLNRLALWHDGEGNPYGISHITGVSAADDLISTIEDYTKFGIYTIKGGGLSTALFDELKKSGLGWGIVKDLPNKEYALHHGGSDIGVKTMAVFLPESKRGIVIMTNGDNGLFICNNIIRQALDVGESFLDSLYHPTIKKKSIDLSDLILKKYEGTYVQANGKNIFIIPGSGSIKISGDGMPTAFIYPETETKFFLPDFDVHAEFIINQAGSTIGIELFEKNIKVAEAVKVQ